MPSIRNLLLRLCGAGDIPDPTPVPAPRPAPEPPANDHHKPAERPVKADATPATVRIPPKPQQPSPRPKTTTPTEDRRQPGRRHAGARAELTTLLNSALKADQALWAPHLLTPAERKRAALVFWRYRRD